MVNYKQKYFKYKAKYLKLRGGQDNRGFVLESSAFADGDNIPVEYTCEKKEYGNNPPLSWHNKPEGTKSFALTVEDPDAPQGTYNHWLIWDIPHDVDSIRENTKPIGTYGKNSSGQNNYVGPCPPEGMHRYIFTVYALDYMPKLDADTDKGGLMEEIKDHILETAKLEGRYQKKAFDTETPNDSDSMLGEVTDSDQTL